MRLTILSLVLSSIGCASIPDGVVPVENFDIARYVGKWYEIARFDHSFERGLDNVSAEYALRDDGGIDIVNRGFARADGKWREAVGRGYFAGARDIAALRVTFFRPFYGRYNVIALDENGSYALVTGGSRAYLWILAREKTLTARTIGKLIDKAKSLGYDTQQLIFVRHDD